MQLAPSALPLGPRGVNSVEMAKHVEPIAESWRTGVQIPPAPPNKPLIFPKKVRGFSLGVEKVSRKATLIRKDKAVWTRPEKPLRPTV